MNEPLIIPFIDTNIYCPNCGSSNTIKKGFFDWGIFNSARQFYGCKDCNRRFVLENKYGDVTLLPQPTACPNCNSQNIRQKGYKEGKRGFKPRYKCYSCGYQFVEKPFGFVDAKEYNEHIKKHPKKMRTELMDARK